MVTANQILWNFFNGSMMSVTLGAISLTANEVKLVAYYSAFVTISVGLWRLNKLFFFYLKQQINFQFNYRRKRYLLLASIFLFASFFTFLFLLSWNKWVQPTQTNWKSFIDSFILMVSFSVLATLFEENNSLNRRRENEILKAEKSERLKIQAELEVLKNQIDPHFLFNSLNTMSFLIENEPAKAKLFNDTLASVYRYILLNKQRNLVVLKEELEFISNYFYLLTIRYPQGLDMTIEIDAQTNDNSLLPPISLQTLLENAIKHNTFSKENPLKVDITVKDSYVSVRNNLQKPDYPQNGSKVGLQNLSSRYQLITNKKISIYRDNNYFLVKLPLINADYHV